MAVLERSAQEKFSIEAVSWDGVKYTPNNIFGFITYLSCGPITK